MKTFPFPTYKGLFFHLTFWVGLIAILNSPLLGLSWGPFDHYEGTLLIPLLYGMSINAILFYSNAYYMIPFFLHKKMLRKFWGRSFLLILGLSIFENVLDVWYLASTLEAVEIRNIKEAIFIYEDNEVLMDIIVLAGSTFLFNLFYWSMAFLYRLPRDWARNERAKQQLIRDKLAAELGFLKAQINPHFLFNGINSIYHLIGMDDEAAKKVLLQFSELLRYQLYDCQDETISIKKELKYVQNYILLEQVRKGEDATIVKILPRTEELESMKNLQIAPLLLTPFLENAFKYLSLFSKKEDNRLLIDLKVKDGKLYLEVENTVDPTLPKKPLKKGGGIGIENVKRRLDLLYPNRHLLNIYHKNGLFKVALQIQLL